MISFESTGSFKKTESFLARLLRIDILSTLKRYGQEGVDALAHATPTNSGLAASSWYYRVGKSGSGYFIEWCNSDVENGFAVAIMLQYGYGTGTGGYVKGTDYINPAIKPIFDRIAEDVWRVVTSS